MIRPLPLSVAIITLNEAANLPRCLESVRDLASELVVVDSGSRDETPKIAQSFNARFEVQPWPGHVIQKNRAWALCTQPWVLAMDADEVVSPELASSIRQTLGGANPAANGLYVNRFTYYVGDWVRHAWYPEWRLRLARREHARWGGLDPHDKLEVTGSTARLQGHLFHYPYTSVMDHFETEIRYAKIMAESYARTGRRGHWYQAAFSPCVVFFKVLLLKGGWLDGWRGWVIAGARGFSTFAKYAALMEMQSKLAAEPKRHEPGQK